MSNVHELIASGGMLQRTNDSVAEVSFWYIPGGCDYHNAQVINGFFSDLEQAKTFAERNRNPPEMACLVDLTNGKVEV